MIQYRKILELYHKGMSQRSISASIGTSRQTVSKVIRQAKEKELGPLTNDMTNQWLKSYLFPSQTPKGRGFVEEDWSYVHEQLKKRHMTLRLLHKEYELRTVNQQRLAYSYRTYCQHYNDYAKTHRLTMSIKRKPGELVEVDWAGETLFLKDRISGENITVYVFVASLPFSQYTYVEAFLDMKSKSWLLGHIHAFEYFRGVPEVLVPDNLRTGVTKAVHAEPVLNEAYRELADYYQTVIVPTRVVKPKDKASVEGNVGYMSRQLIMALRDSQCFSLIELNAAIQEKLTELNALPFQKRSGSRQTVYDTEEHPYMLPLRQPPFEISDWRLSKVQKNYHIQVDRQYYSVPYEYVQCEVDVRLTKDLIEVYFKESRIASHKRLIGDAGHYQTAVQHMPEHHRKYLDHTPESMLEWAKSVGHHMTQMIQVIIKINVEKRALNVLTGMRRLEKQYRLDELETGAEILMGITSHPTLTTFKQILQRQKKRENAQPITEETHKNTDRNHGFVRGAQYFGGNQR